MPVYQMSSYFQKLAGAGCLNSKIKVVVEPFNENRFNRKCTTKNHGRYVHNPDLNDELDMLLLICGRAIDSDTTDSD